MRKYIKDGKTINATEKAFNVIYKGLGYEEHSETSKKEPVQDETGDEKDTVSLEDITKDVIMEQLDEKGIEYNKRDKKEELYDLLLGSD